MPPTTYNSPGVSLRRLLPQAQFWGSDDIITTSCCASAGDCQPGDLFVAIDGPHGDGHQRVEEAIRCGAAAVVAERLLPLDIPVCVVPDSREAYASICHQLAGRPAERLSVIGVTGANGKTITSRLIAGVFQSSRQRVGLTDSLGTFDGSHWFSPLEGDPWSHGPQAATPAFFANLLAKAAANGCRHAIAEVSSIALAQRLTSGISFGAAVLTNVRKSRLDFHGNGANHRSLAELAKIRMLDALAPGGFAVINLDDFTSQSLLERIDCPIITHSQRNRADVAATLLERRPSEQTFLIRVGGDSAAVRTRMVGDHHIANCLAAACVGVAFGVDLGAIARGLESIEHLPGRFERIECGQSFSVFVESGATPDRLAVCLKTLKQTTPGRVVCVLGIDGEHPAQERPLLGRVIERHADVGLITGRLRDGAQNGIGKNDFLPIAHDLLDGYDRPARARLMPDREAAIDWALSTAQPGDAILLAGGGPYTKKGAYSGRRMDSRTDLSDRELVRDWLYESTRQPARPTARQTGWRGYLSIGAGAQ